MAENTVLPGRVVGLTTAAAYCEVDRSTIWRWIKRGDLPAYRIGRRTLRVSMDDVKALIERV
jgi:excisionase family DNA binding protein